jgi:hypothetical protein
MTLMKIHSTIKGKTAAEDRNLEGLAETAKSGR